MNSRDSILAAISKNRPLPKRLPLMDHQHFMERSPQVGQNLADQFTQQLNSNGGEVIKLDNANALHQFVAAKTKTGQLVLNTVSAAGALSSVPAGLNNLEKMHQVFVAGSIAVAENGAIWLDESAMVLRILPFITEELFVVVYQDQLLSNMHEAYDKISINETGFGVFIAGPSKTADIEQSLVIGAHGPKKMVVLLILET